MAPGLDVEHDEVRAALEHADVPVLLMVLVQLTGDRRWLDEPYRPARDISFFADESGGLPADIQARVREAAFELLTADPPVEAAISAPGEELLSEMMSICVGEAVGPEYVPMMREEMGFVERDPTWREPPDPVSLADFRVLVIGAGLSGLCLAAKLEKLGIPYTVVEKNDRVGGTWLENTYPEVGCDVPNHFYSYSFRPNPDWSEYFSKGSEIEGYLERCAAEFGVLPHVRFGLEATSLDWDEARHVWVVQLRRGDGSTELAEADVVVPAVGQLNRPKLPALDGLDRFAGPVFHTARWRHDVELEGKRVAVVGTGASAMQLARTTAERTSRLLIFQRSPQWAIPSRDYHRSVSPQKRWLLEHVPFYAAWYRFTLAWRFGDHLLPTVRRDPDWPHPERSVNAKNDRHRDYLTDFMRSELGDRPDLLAKALPDYPPYGKRILVDNHWFRTLTRDDVDLIVDPIARITETGIVTADGAEHAVDVIVLATGFETTRMLWPLEVRGRGGRSLRDEWGDDDSRAYLGITVPGYPNLFMLYGPNTNLGHGGSIVFVAECQVRYVLGCLLEMLERGIGAIDCRPDAYEGYVDRLDEEHARLIWTHPGMDTWYRNRAGRIVSIMPWRLVDYWQMTREPDLADFAVLDGEPASAG